MNDVGKLHYEKVGEDFEQLHESYRKFHPAFGGVVGLLKMVYLDEVSLILEVC